MGRLKKYGKSTAKYVEMLRRRGCAMSVIWADDKHYLGVSVSCRYTCGYGKEFNTPRAAWTWFANQH